MTELIIKLLEAVKNTGAQIDENRVYLAFETILDNYTIETKSTALAVTTDIPEKAKYFLASKKREAGLSTTTIRNYAYTLRHFADMVYKPVSMITTADIKIYLNNISDRIKASTMETRIYCLKSFFGWLNDEGMISGNPSKKLITPKKPIRMREGLSVEQLELARNACHDPRDRALLEVYLSTGCRVSELEKAKLSDIRNNALRVIGKGDKERIVYFNEKAMMYLKIYINSRKDKSDYIFVSERMNRITKQYKPLSVAGIEKNFNEIGKRCDLHLYPHIFRHTFATMMIKNGLSMRVLQELLGHADPKTTNIYAKVSNVMLQTEHQRCAVA